MPALPSDRPTYSAEQIEQYLNYIQFPKEARLKPGAANSPEGLEFLQRLVRYQLCKVPFENLDLHYSPIKGISLDVDYLFHKIVERQAGRGGYCMQNNTFFACVLRSLGYTVMPTGARVSSASESSRWRGQTPQKAPFGGLGHQVNIVTIEGKKYICDVGFGSSGPTSLYPLEEGFTAMNTGNKEHTATQMLLSRGFMPNNTHHNPEQELWIYSVRYGNDEGLPWVPCYCFTETEFLPSDFEVMNSFVSTSRKSMFVNSVICQIHLMDQDECIVGDITLFERTIKERRLGHSESMADIQCEEDRVNALEKHLGVLLSRMEKNAIDKFHSMVQDTRE